MAQRDRSRNDGPIQAVTPVSEHPINLNRKREPLEHRKLNINLNTVSDAAGSAFVEIGKTKVVVSCYGPQESQRRSVYSDMGQLECEFTQCTFASLERGSLTTSHAEEELARTIVTMLSPAVCLENYPKSIIQVHILVLQDDGAVLSAAVLGASCSLIQAGIEMKDVVTCASTAVVNSTLILDPSEHDLKQSTCSLTAAVMPALGEVCGLVQQGRLDIQQHTEALQAAVTCCSQLNEVVRHVLFEAVGDR
eukprot:m.9891 g.9891  ORF g.9891 m.9891 type:complete len:250 (-) comp9522_c0_seq1:84-833(-)